MNSLILEKLKNSNHEILKTDDDNNIFIEFCDKDGIIKESSLNDFLGLNDREENIVSYYKTQDFTLIGEKSFNEPYPEYIASFISTNKNLIVDGEEKSIPRINEVDKKLIFIKLKQKSNVEETTLDFSNFVSNILNLNKKKENNLID